MNAPSKNWVDVRLERCLAAALSMAALLFALLPGLAWATSDAVVVVDSSGNQIESSKVGADSDSVPSVSKDADAATLTGCAYGIKDYTRYNKGTNKEVAGSYIGYRYPMQGADAFDVITADGYLIVYIPSSVAASLDIDIEDTTFQSNFLSLYASLDSAAAEGGQTYDRLKPPAYFTSDTKVTVGDYVYAFAIEGGEAYYSSVTMEGSDDGGSGALYSSTGQLMDSDDITIVASAEGIDAVVEFFSTLDWGPLWVSLRTTGVAILIIFILGLLAAWLTLRVSNKVKGVLDTVFTIPMVLPPTVCGFLLLLLFGNSTVTGQFFISLGIDLVFTWPAAVIACIVVGFPMMYRTVRGAFENIDVNMLDAARTLGWGEGRIFLRIMMPLAWPSIAAGTVLAFARAMGEFGCTLFFAGNYAGITQTIPLAIYFDWMGGKTDAAIFWVIVVILISFLVILFINIYSSRTQRYRKRLGE